MYVLADDQDMLVTARNWLMGCPLGPLGMSLLLFFE